MPCYTVRNGTPIAGFMEGAARMQTSDVLQKHGILLSDAEFAAMLDEAFEEGFRPLPAGTDDPARTLTVAEAELLAEGGADLRPLGSEEPAPLAEAAAGYGALLAGGLTVTEAAGRLGIDSSRVRHRLAEGSLYGIRLRSGWRLPAFQFDGGTGGVVAGLDTVLRALSPDLHPVAVRRWLSSPLRDLRVDGDSVSPLEWLTHGGDATAVAVLAADL
ncbi:MAG TPA: hypothetical protein VKQ71_14250 [Acidimicrobiales bacterium]|nr:hypothetical protein [Acidimicrobiales bacterium]